MENSTLNGSFLVLNLRNNTVGLGNSSSFPVASNAFNQNPVERTPNLNSVSNMDTLSNSTEEASSASESQKGKRTSREIEDPDWAPEKKVRRSSGSASRTAIPKPGPSVGKNPSEIPPGGDNSMLGSKSGPPPAYLVNLLKFFGWRVIFRPGFSDYIYISPNGVAYYSLPKAFETFLHGTSKYKEKAWSASQFRENRGLNGTFVGGLSGSNIGLQSGAAADGKIIAGLPAGNIPGQSGVVAEGNGEKGKSMKTKNSIVRENVEPETRIKNPQRKQNSVYKTSKDSSCKPGTLVSEGANQVASSSKVNEKTKSHVEDGSLGNESNQMAGSCSLTTENERLSQNGALQDGKLLGVQKSMRISGSYVPVERKVDNTETNDTCSYLSSCNASRNAVRDMEEQTIATSPAKTVPDNMPELRLIDQSSNNVVKRSNRSRMGVTRSTQSSKSCVEKDSQVFGVRRLRRENKKNVPVDKEAHAELRVENSLVSSKSVVNTAARKNKGKSLVSERAIDEKMHFSVRGKSSSSDAQKLDCSNAILPCQTDVSDMHQSDNVLGVRRSVRINGKHVRVDDELVAEMGIDEDFLDLSNFSANPIKDKEELLVNFSGLDNKEGRSPESDRMQLKQTNSKNSDSQKFKTHKQVESHCSRKSVKSKKPGLEKSSASQKEIDVAKRKPAGGGNLSTKQKKKRNRGCSLIVRRNGKDDQREGILPRTKLTILSWLIDFGILAENEKVVYISKNSVDDIPNGLVTRGGIWCDCCKKVEPLSKFKAHAGSNLGQPWDNIFLMSGKTLTQCLLEAWEKEKKHNKVGFQTVGTDGPDPSDDTCGVCADGGHLICCDNCPSTFHQDCVMLKALPEGTWYCPYCRCAFCMIAEHRSKGVPDTSSLLACNQCRRKYHQQCAWGNDINGMGSVPSLFCGKNCKKIPEFHLKHQGCVLHGVVSAAGCKRIPYSIYIGQDKKKYSQRPADMIVSGGMDKENLILDLNVDLGILNLDGKKTNVELASQLLDLVGVTNSMDEEFSWTLLKCLDEDEGISSREKLSFIMECNVKLSMALSVLNECFVPLMDQRTGVDVICQAVYNRGSNFNRLNYEGFYTLVLEKDEEIISVASLRFHGTNLVEMPFVGTRPIYQRQGMCHRLLKAIEDMLSSLCIDKLVIPAIPDLLETWMKSFSFKPLEPSFKDEIRNLSMVVFAQTTLLQKSICNIGAVDQGDDMQTDNSASHVKNTKKNDEPPSTFSEHSKTGGFAAGDQDRQNHEYDTEGKKDDIPKTWIMTSDLPEIQYPKVSNASVFDILPAYDTIMPNLETMSESLTSAPLSFPPVHMVLDHSPLSTGVISTPDSQINNWLQNANEATDAEFDAVTCTLSFENLIRMRS